MSSQTLSKTFTIPNKLGLHARASALFVKTSTSFQSDITVIKDNDSVNGKSIMGILTLAASQGSTITIQATGPDAKKALAELGKLIAKGFNEK